MAKNLVCASLIYVAMLGTLVAQRASSTGSAAPDRVPEESVADRASTAESVADTKLPFAPLWLPVPTFRTDPGSESTLQAPSAAHAIVWEAKWQKTIDLSAEQKRRLRAIHAEAMNELEQHVGEFKSLSPSEQRVRANSWGKGPSPWRQEFDRKVRGQIENVLTPKQLQMVQDFSTPRQIIGLLYDETVRREIRFGPPQQDEFRRVSRERLARFQQQTLTRADQVWEILSPRQRAECSALVRRQGPTSSALSLAYDLGFDREAMGSRYPVLTQPPVRDRLNLSAEQERQLQVSDADIASTPRSGRESKPDLRHTDREHPLGTILSPQQLSTLKQIDFRRRVVLALSDPGKRESIGFSDRQTIAFDQLDTATLARLHQIDREMLAAALQILTPTQREALNAMIQRDAVDGQPEG